MLFFYVGEGLAIYFRLAHLKIFRVLGLNFSFWQIHYLQFCSLIYDKGDQGLCEHLTELFNMSSAAKDKKNPMDK